MRFRDKEKSASAGINITPLIDIVFILLIFFAVTTSFISSNSIKVDLPKAKGEAVDQKKNIRIAVNKEGILFVDGKQIEDSELKGRLQIMKESNPEALVIIEADEKSLHGKVVYIIDTARSVNYTKFAIATEQER